MAITWIMAFSMVTLYSFSGRGETGLVYLGVLAASLAFYILIFDNILIAVFHYWHMKLQI